MIHIFLCDDEPLFLTLCESSLASILQKKHIEYALHSFTNTASLFDALDTQSPDLLLLDLMLGPDDGFSIADMVRRKAIETEIAFITNYPEKIAHAFAYRPIGFISKPINEENLIPVIDRFLFFYQQTHTFFDIMTKSNALRLPIQEILYFESLGHHILLHTTTSPEPLVYVDKLDHVASQLSAMPFVRCHKSYLVNLRAIHSIDRSDMQLTLKNGQTLSLSRRYYSDTLKAFMQDKMR